MKPGLSEQAPEAIIMTTGFQSRQAIVKDIYTVTLVAFHGDLHSIFSYELTDKIEDNPVHRQISDIVGRLVRCVRI